MHPAVLRWFIKLSRLDIKLGSGLVWRSGCRSLAAPILLGLGLDEIGLNPQRYLLKQAINQLTVAAEVIAKAALKLDSAAR